VNIHESLEGVTQLFLDTAPVIYYVEEHPQYLPIVSVVFDRILDGSLMAVTSPVTLAECLVHPYRLGQTQLEQDFLDVIVAGNNTTFVLINDSIAQQAGVICARYIGVLSWMNCASETRFL